MPPIPSSQAADNFDDMATQADKAGKSDHVLEHLDPEHDLSNPASHFGTPPLSDNHEDLIFKYRPLHCTIGACIP